MGLLVDGKWQDKWYDTDGNGGKFKREQSVFRHHVVNSDNAKFPPESGNIVSCDGNRLSFHKCPHPGPKCKGWHVRWVWNKMGFNP